MLVREVKRCKGKNKSAASSSQNLLRSVPDNLFCGRGTPNNIIGKKKFKRFINRHGLSKTGLLKKSQFHFRFSIRRKSEERSSRFSIFFSKIRAVFVLPRLQTIPTTDSLISNKSAFQNQKSRKINFL